MLVTPLELFIRVLLLGFSAILAIVAAAAYRRVLEGRFLLIALAFCGFVALSTLMLASSVFDIDRYEVDNVYVIADLAILLLMYLGLLKR